ncbi:hypothetical protein HRG_009573 [Hirsutella rhossiliensis]|uniref:Uncharacterized protein n=1 Tax=Hirsutella rhossiliensis TaxID=111463 RepID=A0A9P8MTV5_9HYPO|nr:uncharacterized protein HRG_09573 [Hirsutella rhossiliensis]KAH0959112.1 hypothetical protein HRG_09573 [Hirsutella rhossiliensis]
MAQKPSTPVKVPASAANYTPATLDPDMRSQINTVLLRDGHITKIHEALLHALNSDSSNWPTTIHSHALSLLRSGEATTYSALLRRVLDDVRADSPSSSSNKNGGGGSKTPNGDSKKLNGASESPGLALPESVVEEALRVTRESLEAVCEIGDGS